MLELLASDLRPLAQDILSYSLIVCAFIWGSGPERAAAATWLFAFEMLGVLDDVVTGPGSMLTDVDYFLAFKDVVAGALWIVIALYANRNYTLWIAAMQILAMTAHLVRGLIEMISPITYAVMVVAPGWFQLIFLAIGLSRHVLRKRKYGAYRDWRIVPGFPDQGAFGRFLTRLTTFLSYDFFEGRRRDVGKD